MNEHTCLYTLYGNTRHCRERSADGARSVAVMDKIHTEKLKQITKYKRLQPGDPGFDAIAKEIMQNNKEEQLAKKPKRAECKRCGRTMAIVGRGLCSKCYKVEQTLGTLDKNYPARTPENWGGSPVKNTPAPEPEIKTQTTEEPLSSLAAEIEHQQTTQHAATKPQPEPETTAPEFSAVLREVLAEIEKMLLDKNAAYGNSALQPVRVFSTADPVEQLRVRIDDKLSRLMRGHEIQGDDTEADLLGYLILLQIAKKQEDAVWYTQQ